MPTWHMGSCRPAGSGAASARPRRSLRESGRAHEIMGAARGGGSSAGQGKKSSPEVLAYTTRATRAARAASTTFRVPATLTSWILPASFRECSTIPAAEPGGGG